MPHWAYLFEHPTADPRRDRLVLDGEDTRAIVVAVPSAGRPVRWRPLSWPRRASV